MSVGQGDNHTRIKYIGFADSSFRAPIFYDSNDTGYYGDFAGNSRHLRLNLSSAQPDGTVGRLRVSSSTNGASEITSDTYAIMLGPSSTRTGAGYYYAGIAINGLMNYSGGTSYDTAAHIWLGAYYRDTPGSERSDFIVAIKSGIGNTGTGSDLPQVRFRVDYDGIASATGSLRAPIFYDSDNTAYYTNPATGTQINYLNVKGAWGGSPYGSSHAQLNIEGDSYPSITHRNISSGGYWLVHHAADDTMNWYGGTGGYNGTAWNRNMYLDMSGNLTARGNITAYSDRNLKTNIVTIDNALNKVMSLRGVYFDWIESGEHSIGMIAQEVEEILPELIITNDEREVGTEITKIIIKSLDYSKIVSVLVEAIKEQQNMIEELNKRLTSVECK
jgi:hypothetical protein